MLARRHLIASSAALALPACQPPRPRMLAGDPACLPPVKVAPNRVIRTVAGLRPYRPAGFVVRAEALAGKRLVHNYGHGGAGITLSWGTSRLAVDLGPVLRGVAAAGRVLLQPVAAGRVAQRLSAAYSPV
mgnify:CR=1 FL=1